MPFSTHHAVHMYRHSRGCWTANMSWPLVSTSMDTQHEDNTGGCDTGHAAHMPRRTLHQTHTHLPAAAPQQHAAQPHMLQAWHPWTAEQQHISEECRMSTSSARGSVTVGEQSAAVLLAACRRSRVDMRFVHHAGGKSCRPHHDG